MGIVGNSEVRVDAFDKATGRTKYYEDLVPADALYVRIKHSTIAHGFVKSVDLSEAEKIKGVVRSSPASTFRISRSRRRATRGRWIPDIRTSPTAIC